LRRYLGIADTMGKWSGELLAPLALTYLVIILYEVVARYVFGAPTKWAHESSTMIFGCQFMLAGAYCFWRGSMVNVEILHDRLPLRVRAILDLFLSLVPFAICGIMMWQGWITFWDSLMINEHTQTVWGPPLYPARGVIPIAAFLLSLQILAKFIRDLNLAVRGEELQCP